MASGRDSVAVVPEEGHCGNEGVGCLHGSWTLRQWFVVDAGLLVVVDVRWWRWWLWLDCQWEQRLNQINLLTLSSNILSTRSSLILPYSVVSARVSLSGWWFSQMTSFLFCESPDQTNVCT